MGKIKVTAGDFLKEEFLLPLGISGYKLAKDLKVSKTLISNILKGKTSISPDMAVRLSLYFGTTPKYWLNVQNLCDIQEAEERIKDLNIQRCELMPVIA